MGLVHLDSIQWEYLVHKITFETQGWNDRVCEGKCGHLIQLDVFLNNCKELSHIHRGDINLFKCPKSTRLNVWNKNYDHLLQMPILFTSFLERKSLWALVVPFNPSMHTFAFLSDFFTIGIACIGLEFRLWLDATNMKLLNLSVSVNV